MHNCNVLHEGPELQSSPRHSRGGPSYGLRSFAGPSLDDRRLRQLPGDPQGSPWNTAWHLQTPPGGVPVQEPADVPEPADASWQIPIVTGATPVVAPTAPRRVPVAVPPVAPAPTGPATQPSPRIAPTPTPAPAPVPEPAAAPAPSTKASGEHEDLEQYFWTESEALAGLGTRSRLNPLRLLRTNKRF